MAKKYKMKENLKAIGPLTSGPLKGKMLEPGKEYEEGTFPAAYMHMFDEVKKDSRGQGVKGPSENHKNEKNVKGNGLADPAESSKSSKD